MFIKEINITGFRSYRELTSVKDFSPKHNVIVGRNGSGKSNFFTAIQFILSNEFATLSQQDRSAFLHEGVGSRSQTAKVEIVFDNADHRIPSDSSEVKIMRQVGPKKDQYSIDGKVATRSDIVNLMESAGFSRSNPYYIVKQGKIAELATSPDAFRLKLIREVAGTRVFDEKKEESTKILNETKEKIESSKRLLHNIEERLQKLEEEKEDLKEYQNHDKVKRAIEYSIYDFEIRKAETENEKLSKRREEINRDQNEIETKLMEVKRELRENETELRKLEAHYKGIKDEKNSLLAERSDCQEKKNKLEFFINDLIEDVNRERAGNQSAQQRLKDLTADVDKKQEKLDHLKPEYQDLLEAENKLMSEIRISDQKCKELYAKTGYKEQFKTKADRDRHLKREMNFLDKQANATDEQIREIDSSIKADKQEFESLNVTLHKLTNALRDKSSKLDALNTQMKGKKIEIDEAMTQKMSYTRSEKEAHEAISYIQEEITQKERELRRLTSKGTINGINSVNFVLDEFRNEPNNRWIVDGYFGCVIDLLACEMQYNKAIEVIAEGRLFYHVVSNDQVAIKILERINMRDLHGEVNFYPLNRVVAKPRRTVEDVDAMPMLDYIQYDHKFDAVFRAIFANSVFVRDIAAGQRVSKNDRFDCVTLEGDQISRRGPMTGGFSDAKKSKLGLARTLKTLNSDLESANIKLDKITQQLTTSASNVDRVRLEISSLEMDINQNTYDYNMILEKKQTISEQIDRRNVNTEPKNAQIVKLRCRLNEIHEHRTYIEQQMNTELHSQLTPDERNETDALLDNIRDKETRLDEIRKQRVKVENDIQTLRNQLQSNLLRKKENLTAKIDFNAAKQKQNKLAAEQAELKLLNQRLSQMQDRNDVLDNDLEEYEKRRERLTTDLEASQEKKKECDERNEELAKSADIICTKIANYQNKRDESLKKIRDIGSLPTDTLGQYKSMNLNVLHKKLTECMNQLKKYENVNKRALDQFVRASGQKDELTKRVNELTTNERAINNLLTVLDNRRYETLQLTFKQVAKNFNEVFHQLIPQGRADLVMKTLEPSSMESLDRSDRTRTHVLETFVGIGIQVAFTGTAETRELSLLSGGQKTLVALALIFAIQKCDPAPFYLFDEIDAALDPEHRRSVAEMIHELSENAQFITTTFRTELLKNAEKYYGVRFRDKVSYIDPISSAQAHDFIQDERTHS